MIGCKRYIVAVICVGFMLTCLSSVSIGSNKVTIRWMTWLTGDGLLDYKKVIGLFEERNPGYRSQD